MGKNEDIKKGVLIKADIYSRKNYQNGKYKITNIGLDDLVKIKDNDIFFLETLKVRADSADKIIEEAESQGKDTNDPNVMKELGEKINALGKPIHRNESIMTAIFTSLQLVIYFGIAIGIWSFVFAKSFLLFFLAPQNLGTAYFFEKTRKTPDHVAEYFFVTLVYALDAKQFHYATRC